MKNPDIDIDN
jgi:hypothetical protein